MTKGSVSSKCKFQSHTYKSHTHRYYTLKEKFDGQGMRAICFEFWAQSFKQTALMLGIVSLQQCLFAKIKHWGMNYLNNQCNKAFNFTNITSKTQYINNIEIKVHILRFT